jgi:ribosomal protein L21
MQLSKNKRWQFWIETGKYYDFNRIPTELGKQITLNRVLLSNNDGDVLMVNLI